MESFHPLLVHFPIALLLSAFFLETLALLLQRSSWHRISLWNLALGTVGAGVAVLTGRWAQAVAKHSFEISEIMERHEKLGYLVLGLSVSLTGWRLLKKDKLTTRSRWIAWAFLGIACGTMVFSARLGGRMVYEFGVGGSYGRKSGIEVVP